MKRKPLKISWRAWCLDRLAKRDYSEHEMREMLIRRASDSDQEVDADAVIVKLVQDGLIDDRRYIESQISMHTGTFGLKGPRELEKKFRVKGGLSPALIVAYIDPEDRKWYNLARDYCHRSLPEDIDRAEAPRKIPERQFFKLKNSLYRKGFTSPQIAFALEGLKPVKEKRTEERPGELSRLVEKRMVAGRGPYDILQFIKQKGFSEKEIQPYLDLPDEVWIDLASKEREKRFGSGKPGSAKDKRKQTEFLQRRGFLFEHIRRVFEQA